MSTPAQVLVTPQQAMESLQVSYTTLRRMVAAGDLRAVRIGRGKSLRIPTAELERIASGEEAA